MFTTPCGPRGPTGPAIPRRPTSPGLPIGPIGPGRPRIPGGPDFPTLIELSVMIMSSLRHQSLHCWQTIDWNEEALKLGVASNLWLILSRNNISSNFIYKRWKLKYIEAIKQRHNDGFAAQLSVDICSYGTMRIMITQESGIFFRKWIVPIGHFVWMPHTGQGRIFTFYYREVTLPLDAQNLDILPKCHGDAINNYSLQVVLTQSLYAKFQICNEDSCDIHFNSVCYKAGSA